MSRIAVLGVVAAIAAGPACGSGSTPTDAGDVAADDGGFDVPPPDPPAPPVLAPCPEGWVEVLPAGPDDVATCDPWPDGGPAVLTPCPEGWREATDPETGTVTCDPWPEGGPEECTAIDEAHFPGEPGCTRVGTACTDDPWASGLPEDRPIRYVLAGAAPGGDGTRGAPFATITLALRGAPVGTIVAVSKGSFDEVALMPAGVTLWGACTAETVVASSVWAEEEGTIDVWGADVVVRNIRVGGNRPGIWVTERPRSIALEDVVVADATYLGIFVAGAATATGRRVVIRDTRSHPDTLQFGNGLAVYDRAVAEFDRVVLLRNRDQAVSLWDPGAVLRLTNAAVLGTESERRSRLFGHALAVHQGARAWVERSVFRGSRDAAVVAVNPSTEVHLADTVVGDTRPREHDGRGGWGLIVQSGALLEGDRVLVERNREVSASVVMPGTVARLRNAVVRDTTAPAFAGGSGNAGFEVQDGARAELDRTAFERNRGYAVRAFHLGTTLHVTDSVIRDTDSFDTGFSYGWGLEARDGADVELLRTLFERNREVAVSADSTGTTVRLTDLVVRDTRSLETDRTAGWGLTASSGAHVAISRGCFSRNRETSVFASGENTLLELEDVVIADTLGQEATGAYGRGLNVQTGATVEANRILLARNRDGAASVFATGTTVRLTDALVLDTLPDDAEGFWGVGVGTYGGANAELRRFRVSGSALCGVQLAHGRDPETGVAMAQGGTMDLYDGEVAFNTVCGANVQTAGFDLRRLQNNVRWHDNGIDLDTRELPVPEAIGGL
jgi:hypothetical protein